MSMSIATVAIVMAVEVAAVKLAITILLFVCEHWLNRDTFIMMKMMMMICDKSQEQQQQQQDDSWINCVFNLITMLQFKCQKSTEWKVHFIKISRRCLCSCSCQSVRVYENEWDWVPLHMHKHTHSHTLYVSCYEEIGIPAYRECSCISQKLKAEITVTNYEIWLLVRGCVRAWRSDGNICQVCVCSIRLERLLFSTVYSLFVSLSSFCSSSAANAALLPMPSRRFCAVCVHWEMQ